MARMGHIQRDLRLERIGGGPAHLRPNAIKKMQRERSSFVKSNGMETEQMAFYGKGICAKGGPIADVCDRFKTLASIRASGV